MDRLRRRRPDRAHRKGGRCRLWHTVKAFRAILDKERFSDETPSTTRSITLSKGCTWPRYPAVPDSTRGTPAAMHILLTCRRASGLQYCQAILKLKYCLSYRGCL